jgi:hypothetical protein
MGVEGGPSRASFARSCLRTTAGCAWMRFYRGINGATSHAPLVMADGWPDGAHHTHHSLRGVSPC